MASPPTKTMKAGAGRKRNHRPAHQAKHKRTRAERKPANLKTMKGASQVPCMRNTTQKALDTDRMAQQPSVGTGFMRLLLLKTQGDRVRWRAIKLLSPAVQCQLVLLAEHRNLTVPSTEPRSQIHREDRLSLCAKRPQPCASCCGRISAGQYTAGVGTYRSWLRCPSRDTQTR